MDTTLFLHWIDELNQYDPADFADFVVNGSVLGAIPVRKLDLFARHPDVFQVAPGRVVLHPRLDTADARTRAVAGVLNVWRAEGMFPGWRDELYRVSPGFHAPPSMYLERSAASLFGIHAYGIHLNGWTMKDGQRHLWIARRSWNKPRFPGMLDHLVAGGLTAGLSPHEVTVKECGEEAGIPTALAQQAMPVGFVSYRTAFEGELSQDLLFTYDLQLPASFTPANTDGEVDSFQLLPVKDVMELVANTREFKINCNLVLIDFFVRHGYIRPEDPRYVEIVQGLRAAF